MSQSPLPPGIGTVVGWRPLFRLDRHLGGGAFGDVFLATTLDAAGTDAPEQVAVKVLTGDLHENVRLHVLQRELSSLRAVSCPRIPRVFAADLDEPHPHLAMEYFPHGTLEDLLDRVDGLEEHEATALLESLLEAVEAAHNADVLHLDVKPANVLLDGAGGFVLTDFGLAQAPRQRLALHGLGSEGWQAPEQEAGARDKLDQRTDLFGVGATVWSALTGIDLASRRGQSLRHRARSSNLALPPVSAVRTCPPGLQQVVMSLLLRDREGRPGSASEVRGALEAMRSGQVNAGALLPGRLVAPGELKVVLGQIVDPLVARLFRSEQRGVRQVHDGEALCRQGERSHHAYCIIRGAVRVVRDGVEIARVDREGTFLGEVAALTGRPRTAALLADGEVYVKVLNAAQLESLVSANPALAVRLIRTMARRFPPA